MSSVLHFSGHQHLRHRLALSILSGKHVRIDKIRPDDKNPGLRGRMKRYTRYKMLNTAPPLDFEISLLRLIEKVTNGTVIEISVTGKCWDTAYEIFSYTHELRHCHPC
jgi:RNA 3'-terminal phosphate cyclase-like protein